MNHTRVLLPGITTVVTRQYTAAMEVYSVSLELGHAIWTWTTYKNDIHEYIPRWTRIDRLDLCDKCQYQTENRGKGYRLQYACCSKCCF